MSNEEEKRCPLCAEEMDWTDQQFKPCKCGYQVCVWCWHHIIDMAEKDETEGRCPACRTIYEKDKIVTMQANCERMVTKNSNRKSKPPKATKPKAPEIQKDLTNVRVIQRKMAYVIGLPLTLADEDLLQRREYFGQYGKISKISLSRTAGGAIQQFINESCSVYVTYSKEEEALRCIQSVHGYVLEGRFLRASFGTAKYCHAWLRNTPCNNPACLYLHSLGAEEDSFGKDEVAAVHTRNRVQQIVGDANNLLRRSGSVLPPPVDELSNYSSTSEKCSVKASLNDSANDGHLTGGFGVPNNMTTFVDIVGQPGSSGSEKDGIYAEDRRILNICSDLSSVTLDDDNQAGDPYYNSVLYKVPSSSRLINRLPTETNSEEFSEELFKEDILPYDDLLSKDSSNYSHRGSFHHSSYPAKVSEDSGGHSLMHRRNHSSSNYSTDHNSVHSLEDEASLLFTRVNSVLNDKSQELKFQSSAKSDRVYRSSNSFSNEEIVEHLRRIGDDNLTNDDESSALDAVESSIISNIMSMDFDSCDDSLKLPHGLTELLDETDDRHGPSWNSYTSGKSGLLFAKRDGFASQVANFEPSLNNLGQVSRNCSLLKDYGGNTEHYLSKPHYQAPRSPSLAPPGFSVPSREAPPGFSAYEKTGRDLRSSSGSLVNNSFLSDSSLQMPSTGNNSSKAEFEHLTDPAMLSCGNGKPRNILDISGLGTGPASDQQLSAFDDGTRHWSMIQQPSSVGQDSKYSQVFVQQTAPVHKEPRFPGLCEISAFSDIYGYSTSLMETYDPSSFRQLSQQKLANGLISNGYQHSLDEVPRINEVGMADLQRNEKRGLNKYISGYGDIIFPMTGSGDVYTRVFGCNSH